MGKKKLNKNKKNLIILAIGLFLSIFWFPLLDYNRNHLNLIKRNFTSYDSIRTIKLSDSHVPIHVDNNWTATKIAGICNGSGTYSDPYIIEDYEINGGITEICINIENSNDYFIVKNCTLYNAFTGSGAIRLSIVSNGKIIGNKIYNNNGNGITISSSENNKIIGNNISNNQDYGIRIRDNSRNNLISENNLSLNGLTGFPAISLLDSDNNSISRNNIFNNPQDGIHLQSSVNNTISENNIANNNQNGIRLVSNSNNNSIAQNNITLNSWNGLGLSVSSNNSIDENNFSYNSGYGINMYYISQNNTIYNNTLYKNRYGIGIGDKSTNICNYNRIIGNTFLDNRDRGVSIGSHHNLVYLNHFYYNGLPNQAFDNGTSNEWDNGSIGNYWSDYEGSDINGDGIGDDPYCYIEGDSNSQDNFPIYFLAPKPNILITSHDSNDLVKEITLIQVSCTSPFRVNRVEFWVSGYLKWIDNSEPYNFSWDTTQLIDDAYIIEVVAIDTLGQENSTTIILNTNNGNTLNFDNPTETFSVIEILLYITTSTIGAIGIISAILIGRRFKKLKG